MVVRVNLRKLVGFLVVIFVLFWVISAPGPAGNTVNNLLGDLRDAGDSIVTFIQKVV
jgi:hypothetical protein